MKIIDHFPKLLSKRQVEVLTFYFGLGDESAISLEEIAYKYGITKVRARQIKDRAIVKLQRKMDGITD